MSLIPQLIDWSPDSKVLFFYDPVPSLFLTNIENGNNVYHCYADWTDPSGISQKEDLVFSRYLSLETLQADKQILFDTIVYDLTLGQNNFIKKNQSIILKKLSRHLKEGGFFYFLFNNPRGVPFLFERDGGDTSLAESLWRSFFACINEDPLKKIRQLMLNAELNVFRSFMVLRHGNEIICLDNNGPLFFKYARQKCYSKKARILARLTALPFGFHFLKKAGPFFIVVGQRELTYDFRT